MFSDVDIENDIVSTITSDYYEQDNFRHTTQNLKTLFSLFHLNIGSLNLHFEELHAALNMSELSFDVIDITETKLSDSSKNSDISMPGYVFRHQPTKSFCGGSAIYVNDELDHFPTNDLSTCQKEFETICICKRNRNIICCCVYKNPNTDQNKFLQYLDSSIQKMAKEKKGLYIMGDFNFDLLNLLMIMINSNF